MNLPEDSPVVAAVPEPTVGTLPEPQVQMPPEVLEPTPLAPVGAAERIEILDILRGFALLGILLVNMGWYTTPRSGYQLDPPYWPDLADRLANWGIGLLAAGKFYILFSFLFGHGIAIQMLRAEMKDQRKGVWLHVRRMLILLAIGLVHSYLIWHGDILVPYALVGLLFLFFLRRRPITLLLWAGGIYLLALLVVTAGFGIYGLVQVYSPSEPKSAEATAKQQAEARTEAAEQKAIYGSGTYLEITKHRAWELITHMYKMVAIMMLASILPMFLLGMWAGRRGVFRDLPAYLGCFRTWRWPALAVGLTGNLVVVVLSELVHADFSAPFFTVKVWCAALGAPCLTFFYVSTLAIASTSPIWHKPVSFLAPMGQMALTNYLAQSIICTTIFYGYGLGLYAEIGPAWGLVLTVAIWLVEVIWSNLWLRVLGFRFGPMEWLWRSLTYGRLQPIR